MIASAKVRKLLSSLSTGFFLEPVQDAPDHEADHLFVKLPLELITAVQCGAALSLWVGEVTVESNRVVCATLYVADDPVNGFYLSRTLNAADVTKLEKSLENDACVIHFFDEHNRLLMSAQCSTSTAAVAKLGLPALRDHSFPDSCIADALRQIADRAATAPSFLHTLPFSVAKESEIFWIRDLGFIAPAHGANRYNATTVLGQDPGAKLEERVTQFLTSLFGPSDTSISPWLSGEEREFCDILVTNRTRFAAH